MSQSSPQSPPTVEAKHSRDFSGDIDKDGPTKWVAHMCGPKMIINVALFEHYSNIRTVKAIAIRIRRIEHSNYLQFDSIQA